MALCHFNCLGHSPADFVAKEKFEDFTREIFAKQSHRSFGMDEIMITMWIQSGLWIVDQIPRIPGEAHGTDVHEMRAGDLTILTRVNLMYAHRALQLCMMCIDAWLKRGLKVQP